MSRRFDRLLRLTEAIALRLSPSAARRTGEALGALLWYGLRLRRRVALGNIARSFPDLAHDACLRLGGAIYRHLGRLVLEFLRLPALTPEQARSLLGVDNVNRVRTVLSAGRGALVLSAHLGNWDLLACCAGLCGLPVNVITRRIKAGWLDRYWQRTRARCGVRLLPHEGSAREIVRALKNNEIVVFVLDQHDPHGVPLPFLGRPAATSLSLARVARSTGAPVLPVFLPRRGDGYVGWVGEPLFARRSDDRGRDLLEDTRDYNGVIEQMVREYPEQWFWVHRRWKVSGQCGPQTAKAGHQEP